MQLMEIPMTDILAADFSVTSGPLPASRKIHVPGRMHPELRVAMREIDLSAAAGEPPVRVYDPSGPYTDPGFTPDIRHGLPELRRPWIEARGDTEIYGGRAVRPEDNGLKPGETSRVPVFDRAGRRPRRGHPQRKAPVSTRETGRLTRGEVRSRRRSTTMFQAMNIAK